MPLSPDSSSDEASLLAARRLADAADDDGAEAVFLDLLARHRGSETALERSACSSLVTLYGRQQRFFEATALARHLRLLGEIQPRDPGALAYAAFARATSWLSLGADKPAEDELVRLERFCPEVSGERGQLLARGALALRLRQALQRRDVVAARAAWTPYEASLGTAPRTAGDEVQQAFSRAALEALEGWPDEALESLQRAESLATDVQDRVKVGLGRLDVLTSRGRDTESARCAGELVPLLEESMLERHASQLAWDGGRRVIELLSPKQFRLQVRVWELLTLSLDLRMQELRRALGLLPEIGAARGADRHIFERIAVRARRWRARVRKRLQPRIERLRREVPGGNVALRRTCAWCDAIHLEEHGWVPFLDGIEITGRGHVTHGICPGCRAELPHLSGFRGGADSI